MSTTEATGSLQAKLLYIQLGLVLCCLDGEEVVGSNYNPILAPVWLLTGSVLELLSQHLILYVVVSSANVFYGCI